MRRRITLGVATLAFALTLPAIHVDAVCAPAPDASSAAGRRTMLAAQMVVWGTVTSSVPADAHGVHSFFLKVRGYFKGAGPVRIEVTDLGDGDLPAVASVPGSAEDASQTFVDHFAGQDAVIFAERETGQFVGQFTTTSCTYTAYGDAATADILPLVKGVFGAAQPPNLAGTGPASVAALAFAAMALLVVGIALHLGTRPKLLVAGAPAR